MKLTQLTYLAAIGLALTFSAVGCKKTPTQVTPIPTPSQSGNPNGSESNGNAVTNGDTTGGVESTAHAAANPSDWENAKRDEKFFESDTVHFAYDSSVVRSSEQSKVEHVADYLKSNPGTGVEIEGHCDERGTDQYNYALGERRASALREDLIGKGVDGSRILTKSFGRTRPVDTGHSDAAHAKNRRGVFVLLTK
ncbi:MAG: OmpA family protein [Verrucomicrobiota bacterium]